MKTIIKKWLVRVRGTKLKLVFLAALLLIGIKFSTQATPGIGSVVTDPGHTTVNRLAWLQQFQNFIKQYGTEISALQQLMNGNYLGAGTQLLTKHLGVEQLGFSNDQLNLFKQIYNPLSNVINGGNSVYVQKFNKLVQEVDKSSNSDLISDVLDPRMSLNESKDAFKGSFLFITAVKVQASEIRTKFGEVVSANSSNTSAGSGGTSPVSGSLADLNNPTSISSDVPSSPTSGSTAFSSIKDKTLKARNKLMLTDGERIQLMEKYIHEMEILLAATRLYKARAINLVKAIVSMEQDGKMQYFGSGAK